LNPEKNHLFTSTATYRKPDYFFGEALEKRTSRPKKCSNLNAFGSVMPGRNASSGDDEIKGSGNSINYKYRMHDPRIGRFLSRDPLAPEYPHNSPYAFSENRVVDAVELEGLEYQIVVHLLSFNEDGIASISKTKIKKWKHTDIASENKNSTGRPQFNGSQGLGDQVYYVDAKTGEIIKNHLINLDGKLVKSGYVESFALGAVEYGKRANEKMAYNNEYGEPIDAPYTPSTYGSGDGETNPDVAKEEHFLPSEPIKSMVDSCTACGKSENKGDLHYQHKTSGSNIVKVPEIKKEEK